MQDIQESLSSFQGGGAEPNKRAAKPTPAMDCISKMRSEFQAKMSDDLNTAQILTGAFQDALKLANSSSTMLKVCAKSLGLVLMNTVWCFLLYVRHAFNIEKYILGIFFFQKKLQKQQQLSLIQSLTEVEKEVQEILNILGLLSSSSYSEVRHSLHVFYSAIILPKFVDIFFLVIIS